MRAQFPGFCDLCEDKITPGDDIRRASQQDDSWVHVDCMTRLDDEVSRVLGRLGVKAPRCPACADLLAKDGSCLNCAG